MTGRLPHPRLILEYFDNQTSDFGPGANAGIIEDAVKVGWSWYSRFPASCYFTLRQDSPHALRLVPGLTHMRIWYVNATTGYGPRLVWNGRLSDPDQTGRDIIWRGFNYLSELALSRTGYRVMYAGKKISVAVKREWKRNAQKKGKKKFKEYGARVQEFGLLQHVGTGVLENPTRAGKPVKLDPQFGVIDVPRLLFFYDLTEIGRANTTQNVVYDISRSTSPNFRFRADAGDALDLRLEHPGNIRDFRYRPGVTDIRNDIATLGTKRGQAVEIKRTVEGGKYGMALFGRRQDTFAIKTLSGFRNLDDDAAKFSAQKTITRRAVKEATRPTRSLVLDVPYTELEPFDGWDIEDVARVRILRDDTRINKDYRFVGVTGTLDDSGYRQQLYMVTEDA